MTEECHNCKVLAETIKNLEDKIEGLEDRISRDGAAYLAIYEDRQEYRDRLRNYEEVY